MQTGTPNEYTSEATSELTRVNFGDAEHVQVLAASNPEATSEVLEALASSNSPYVRSKVAENEHAPEVVLDSLMHDCPLVRAALANSPKAIERVWLLVQDPEFGVRLALASNMELPEHVYHVLAKDEDMRVARRARRTLAQLRASDNPVSNFFKLFSKVA